MLNISHFLRVPEVDPSNTETIEKLIDGSLPFAARNIDLSSLSNMAGIVFKDMKLVLSDFNYPNDNNPNNYLHRDEGSDLSNSPWTIHVTYRGWCRFYGFGRNNNTIGVDIDSLKSTPRMPIYATDIMPRTAVVFRHRLPHLFQNKTNKRESSAMYCPDRGVVYDRFFSPQEAALEITRNII